MAPARERWWRPWRIGWAATLYAQLAAMALVFAAIGAWQYATRTIYWNPHRHLRVHLRRPVRRVGTLGRGGGDRRLTRTVRVGFQPVVVRTRR